MWGWVSKDERSYNFNPKGTVRYRLATRNSPSALTRTNTLTTKEHHHATPPSPSSSSLFTMSPQDEPTTTRASSPSSEEGVSRIFLIRHGDRFDYANSSWLDRAQQHGALVTDPPLSALGHRQAQETADHLVSLLQCRSVQVTKILVSPYLRVLQTACPLSDALQLPLCIERGLSEAHATPGILPSAAARFAYFPHVDVSYSSLVPDVTATPGFICRKTGVPCEAFAGHYVARMDRLARALERHHAGDTVVCYSHAASTALVAALLQCSLRDLTFAPCGIFELQRGVGQKHWTLVTNGAVNTPHVTENSPTTFPWGFQDKHFQEQEASTSTTTSSTTANYFGTSQGIGLDYFVPKVESSIVDP